jgi:hypothetical protein
MTIWKREPLGLTNDEMHHYQSCTSQIKLCDKCQDIQIALIKMRYQRTYDINEKANLEKRLSSMIPHAMERILG